MTMLFNKLNKFYFPIASKPSLKADFFQNKYNLSLLFSKTCLFYKKNASIPRYFSGSSISFSIFDSKNIIKNLSELNLNNKEDFVYVNDVTFDSNILLCKKLNKDLFFKLGPLDSPDFLNNLRLLLDSFEDFQIYVVYFRVPTLDGGMITTHRQLFLDKNSNPEWIKSRISYKIQIFQNEYYEVSSYSEVIVQYRPVYLSTKTPVKYMQNIPKTFLKNLNVKNNILSNKFIPLSMDLSKFGVLHSFSVNDKGTNIFIYLFNEFKFVIEKVDSNVNFVKVYDKSDLKVFEFYDENFGDYFIRNINDIYIKIDHNENILYTEKTFNNRFVNKTQKELIRKNKIITFDIETYLEPMSEELMDSLDIYNKDKSNNQAIKMFIPYACGFYDGESYFKFYLTDYPDFKAMLKACLMGMANIKYKGYIIYAHYGGKFDYVYLLNVINNLEEVKKNPKIIDKDGNIIGIDVEILNPLNLNKNNKIPSITLKFRDSYKLLPSSLRKLTNEFKVSRLKGIFPYLFPNSSNLNYIGVIPDYKYFNNNDLSLNDYNLLKAKFSDKWDLKEETFKYLESDLIGLHQVIKEFSDIIYKKYRLNISKVYSISSLAMKIFTSGYLDDKNPEKNISIISNKKIHRDIRNAYYGGRVEIFKPFVKNFKLYDVNSLYPFAMLFPMPVGTPIYSTNTNLKDLFGIVYATVYIPEFADPVLPKRLESGELIFPKGTWSAWFFSEELKNAEFFGAKITVHHSYLFNKSYSLFRDFILDLYEMKSKNSGSIRAIYKLLMNSSYGRWGLKFYKTVTQYMTADEANKIELTHIVQDRIDYSKDRVYLRYNVLPEEELFKETSNDKYGEELVKTLNSTYDPNSSIPIGIAVTSWARIFMSSFLFSPSNPVAYTDTDSIVVKYALSLDLINNSLGGWKLEHEVLEGLFVLDKVYNLITDKGSITKNKGVSNKLSYLDFISLYRGKSLNLVEERWVRSLSHGLVYINEVDININNNYTKKTKVFNSGNWVATEPLTVYYDKIVNTNYSPNLTYENYLYLMGYNNSNIISRIVYLNKMKDIEELKRKEISKLIKLLETRINGEKQ